MNSSDNSNTAARTMTDWRIRKLSKNYITNHNEAQPNNSPKQGASD